MSMNTWVKDTRTDIAVCEALHHYGICHMGSHSVTCYPAMVTPASTPAKAGTWFSDPRGMQGWSWPWWWGHPEIVYPPKMVTYLRN